MKLKSLGKFFKVWYPSILIMVFIFIMSSFAATDSDRQSGFIINAITFAFPELANVPFLVNIVRKSAHFIEYAILGFSVARSMKLSGAKHSFTSVIACAIYASTDEFHQSFTPGRSSELKDVLLDTLGASFGILIYWLITHKKTD